jgi:hypothetical protein
MKLFPSVVWYHQLQIDVCLIVDPKVFWHYTVVKRFISRTQTNIIMQLNFKYITLLPPSNARYIFTYVYFYFFKRTCTKTMRYYRRTMTKIHCMYIKEKERGERERGVFWMENPLLQLYFVTALPPTMEGQDCLFITGIWRPQQITEEPDR